MNQTFYLRHVLLLACTMAVCGCTTLDYRKPVNDFADATGRAQGALSELNAQVTEGYRQVLEKKIVNRKLLVQFDNEDCQVTSDRCRLIMVDSNKKNLGRYPPEPPLQRMILVMADINRYAANLKALVEADAASKVEGQVNAALGSTQKLAETLAALGSKGTQGRAIPQFATPVGQALNWIIGQYVERVKLKGLQHATQNARQVIHEASNLFTTTSLFAADTARADFAEEVSQALDALRSVGNESSLGSLAQHAARYDAFLVSAPPRLFEHMGAAHDALAENLQGESVTFGTAIARIEAFASEAAKVAKILEDIRALAGDKKGP